MRQNQLGRSKPVTLQTRLLAGFVVARGILQLLHTIGSRLIRYLPVNDLLTLLI
jgi:hypothetical protein